MYIIFWKPLQDYIIYNYAALYHICKALYLVLVTKTIADTHTGTHGHTWTHADTRPRERERERERHLDCIPYSMISKTQRPSKI